MIFPTLTYHTLRRRRRAGSIPDSHRRTVALIGNPNSGKTTLFNALTGLRQKVGNYPGVTVEKKEGRLTINSEECTVLDLPGTYSFLPGSPDEQITVDVLTGRVDHSPIPDLVVCVVDAGHVERSLYLVSQVIDRQLPLVIALNMVDAAGRNGIRIDAGCLAQELGVPVVETIANKQTGIEALKHAIALTRRPSSNARLWQLPEPVERECKELVTLLGTYHKITGPQAFEEATTLMGSESAAIDLLKHYHRDLRSHLQKNHQKLEFLGIDRNSIFVESRNRWIRSVCSKAVKQKRDHQATFSDRIDRVVTHRFWGLIVFLAVMAILFQSIFTWSAIPTGWVNSGFDLLESALLKTMPPGDLRDLVVRGALGGVSAVVGFLPQIMLLFLFIGLLEDSGYMARAAFVMDRIMGRVGLHGKSFIPLLSSFACAIPGIMATRTIENPKDRLATMLVAPLMSCSARLPVYTLLIAAFMPPVRILGFFSLAGLTLLSMYLLGLLAALGMAWLFKRTLLKTSPPVFLMELPQYCIPSFRSVLTQMIGRASSFLRKAGTVILGASILLWFLATYPRLEGVSTPAQRLEHSFAGMAGKSIEPLIRPLGFDWKVGIGLVSSLLQREMFVSTMGTIYNIDNADDARGIVSLQQRMREDRDPSTGGKTFTLLTAICVMVYYVLAMQCLSTVAVMQRETNGWRWPAFQIAYMTALAYGVTFIVYRSGLWLGLGG